MDINNTNRLESRIKQLVQCLGVAFETRNSYDHIRALQELRGLSTGFHFSGDDEAKAIANHIDLILLRDQDMRTVFSEKRSLHDEDYRQDTIDYLLSINKFYALENGVANSHDDAVARVDALAERIIDARLVRDIYLFCFCYSELDGIYMSLESVSSTDTKLLAQKIQVFYEYEKSRFGASYDSFWASGT